MNALESLWNGSLSGKREQTILTPEWILENLRCEWGEIACEPCPAPGTDSWHCAASVLTDGLAQDWPDKTYCNPPYAQLRKWLAHCVKQEGVRALLCPVRTHRWWYRQARATCSAAIQFNPFSFVGFKHAFPAPLELLCWGWSPTPSFWHPHGVTDIEPTFEHPGGQK